MASLSRKQMLFRSPIALEKELFLRNTQSIKYNLICRQIVCAFFLAKTNLYKIENKSSGNLEVNTYKLKKESLANVKNPIMSSVSEWLK